MNEDKSVFDRLQRVAGRRREADDVAQQERYRESSKKRLLSILVKKQKTGFIGALDRFERFFGALWGHGKEGEERTPREEAWFKIWQECRTEILNNGNNQLRAVESELALYTVHWDRYQLNLPVMPEPGGRPATDVV